MAPVRSLLLLAGIAPLLSGCAGQDTASAPASNEVNAGLAHLLSEQPVATPPAMPESLSDSFAQAAADIAAMQAEDSQAGPPAPDPSETVRFALEPAEANPQPPIEIENLDLAPTDDPIAQSEMDESASDAIQTAEATPTEPEETPGQRKARLLAELSAVLREDIREGVSPVQAHAALAALIAIDPDTMDMSLTDPSLSDREVEVLRAWRMMLRRSAENLVGSEGDATALVDAVEEAADALGSWKPLDIASAALCSRVEGYGRYTELPSRLLAGRDHPAIVYVELERFAVEPGLGPDREPGFVSRVTMELSLYHDSDGLLAWRSSAREVKDFSRRQRRDFFLVQRVDLPSTLTVGMYQLKITVRDRISGAEAERILPIDVVADVALIRDR